MFLKDLASGSVLESADQISSTVSLSMSDEDYAQLMAVGMESVMTDEEIDNFIEVSESMLLEPVEERTIVKLDKRAKKNKLYKAALYQEAKEKNDPDYKKLVTLWKMTNYLTKKLEKKHGTKAKSRMKEMEKKAKTSKANPIKAMADKLTRSEKQSKAAKKLGAAPKGLASKSSGIIASMQSKVK